MNYREIVRAVIEHKDAGEVPYTLDFEGDVADRLDAYYAHPAWRSWIKPYILGVSAFDMDPKTPIDASHSRDPYGGIWRDDRLPWHLETPALGRPSFDGYVFPTLASFFRAGWKEQALRTTNENPDSFVYCNLGWGLWERSWNLRGFENALMDAIDEPDFFGEMLDRLKTLYLEKVAYIGDLPVDGIYGGDDWGDQRGVTIGAKRWRKFIKPRWAEIYAAIHKHGKIVMHHSCGSVAEIIPDLIEIGVDVLESVQPEANGMNPYELKQKWGDQITFWGCLGSQSTIPFGTPAGIRKEVNHLKTEMGKGGGFILSPAKPLQLETPTENAVAVLESFIGNS